MKEVLFYLTVLSVLTGCISTGKIDSGKIYNKMKSNISFISRRKSNIAFLKQKTIGETGFFYIIDRNGMVLYHPKSLLIGKNFRKYSFINTIIERGSGCIRYSFVDIEHLVYFRPMPENRILCLSIPAAEVYDYNSMCAQINMTKNSR